MIRALAFVWLYTVVAAVSPQNLTPAAVTGAPAANGGGLPWWVSPAVAIVLLVVGWILLKRKYPGTAAKVSTDAEALGKMIGAATQAAVAHIQANPAPAATPEVAAPAADLQPDLEKANGKLAQIKAIVDA